MCKKNREVFNKSEVEMGKRRSHSEELDLIRSLMYAP